MNRLKLTTRSKVQLTLLAVALVIVLALLDQRSAPEILFSVFYLLPVFVVSCYVGRAAGLIVALASAVAWFVQMDGDVVAFHHWLPYWNAVVLFGFYTIASLIISTLKRACEDAERSSAIDFLTGISNSRAFHDLAYREKRRASRYHRPLTLAYLDLDNFKEVNDRYGHATGDRVLVDTARVLRHTLRETDILARIGGDEFVILLPETGYEAASVVLDKVHDALKQQLLSDSLQVTFSLGAVTFLTQPDTVADLVRQADFAMYNAKRDGKDRIVHELIGEPETVGAIRPAE
ncbi:MAG: GGDEF domain-containing protein [Terriglobales bacterium]